MVHCAAAGAWKAGNRTDLQLHNHNAIIFRVYYTMQRAAAEIRALYARQVSQAPAARHVYSSPIQKTNKPQRGGMYPLSPGDCDYVDGLVSAFLPSRHSCLQAAAACRSNGAWEMHNEHSLPIRMAPRRGWEGRKSRPS